MANAAPPLLLFVVGPPAVGKMAVGQAITERTGLRLFHNHIAIELALRYSDHGTPAFHRIDGKIRRLVIEEVAASDLPGLVFTYVWAFNLPEDQAQVEEYAKPFRERGARVLFVELMDDRAHRRRRPAVITQVPRPNEGRHAKAPRLPGGEVFAQRSGRARIRCNLGLTPYGLPGCWPRWPFGPFRHARLA